MKDWTRKQTLKKYNNGKRRDWTPSGRIVLM